jgi:hypothetical protein
MNSTQLKASIERANQKLAVAEREMQQALQIVANAPPDEKTMISSALSTAFGQLKAAREEVAALARKLADE